MSETKARLKIGYFITNRKGMYVKDIEHNGFNKLSLVTWVSREDKNHAMRFDPETVGDWIAIAQRLCGVDCEKEDCGRAGLL